MQSLIQTSVSEMFGHVLRSGALAAGGGAGPARRAAEGTCRLRGRSAAAALPRDAAPAQQAKPVMLPQGRKLVKHRYSLR